MRRLGLELMLNQTRFVAKGNGLPFETKEASGGLAASMGQLDDRGFGSFD